VQPVYCTSYEGARDGEQLQRCRTPHLERLAISLFQIAIDELLNMLFGGYAVRLPLGFPGRFFSLPLAIFAEIIL
jgi:hypothetical protein